MEHAQESTGDGMKLRKGDMWDVYERSDLFLITTNGRIAEPQGKLVMGRGVAKEARDMFPGLDRRLALKIKSVGVFDEKLQCWRYGFIPGANLGILQVKYHWNHVADLALIQFSVNKLAMWTDEHQGAIVNMPFPGIGAGRLKKDQVMPIIEWLPDNVTVWEKE